MFRLKSIDKPKRTRRSIWIVISSYSLSTYDSASSLVNIKVKIKDKIYKRWIGFDLDSCVVQASVSTDKMDPLALHYTYGLYLNSGDTIRSRLVACEADLDANDVGTRTSRLRNSRNRAHWVGIRLRSGSSSVWSECCFNCYYRKRLTRV